ncbi:MAG: hypothetical protein KDC45_10590 [Bacteroidetes bacterium]|nr:hypothetical protein [Bacteroidota bacterium]
MYLVVGVELLDEVEDGLLGLGVDLISVALGDEQETLQGHAPASESTKI